MIKKILIIYNEFVKNELAEHNRYDSIISNGELSI